MALKRVDRSVSLQLREPISKNRLEDARTLALIPRLPYPGSAKDLRTRPHHAEEYKRLFNMFDTQYHISPENLRVVLYVADLIKQPIPFIRVPSVRDLSRKMKELADDIERAERTGFLLAKYAEKYDAQEIVVSTRDGGAIEVTDSPRVQRIMQSLLLEQTEGEEFVSRLRDRADIYGSWVDNCYEKEPPRARRLGRLKRLFVGLYLEYKIDSARVPYNHIADLLNCVHGFGSGSLDGSRYRRDLREFTWTCKDSWVLLCANFRKFDPEENIPDKNQFIRHPDTRACFINSV